MVDKIFIQTRKFPQSCVDPKCVTRHSHRSNSPVFLLKISDKKFNKYQNTSASDMSNRLFLSSNTHDDTIVAEELLKFL